jgi:uncharacterized protein
VKQSSNGFVNNRVLKLNVGFLLGAGPGKHHETEFDVPRMRLDDEVEVAWLRGPLTLSRTKEGILVQGTLTMGVDTECSRCLTPVQQEVTLDVEELFAYPTPNGSEFLIGEDAVLDLTPLVRDEAIIADTYGVLCRPDCKGLCVNCGTNLNEGACTCDDDIDPRFAQLRALLNR